MKVLPGYLLALVLGLVVLAAVAPVLTALAGALVPLVIVLAVAAIALRLAFFHTRRW